jgi:membrane-associated phospholipid phosphatase
VTRALEPGATYGNMTIQVPLAIGWWAASNWANSARGAAAGRDLLRAQISAFSWTYAIKYAVDRERPNGDPRSFPSGHSSATFAAAMVFHEHYGWKIGVPLFAAATYTAASRITVNKHWASDVAFGAVVGMVSGRTVTLQLRRARFTVSPVRTRGGAAIVLSAY